MLARLPRLSALALQGLLVELLAPLVRDTHHGSVVDVVVLLVVGAESFQRPRDVATAFDGITGFAHLGIVAKEALVP